MKQRRQRCQLAFAVESKQHAQIYIAAGLLSFALWLGDLVLCAFYLYWAKQLRFLTNKFPEFNHPDDGSSSAPKEAGPSVLLHEPKLWRTPSLLPGLDSLLGALLV